MKNSERNHRGETVKPRNIGKYLEIHPGVVGGRLIFKGTRVPVEVVLAFVANGMSIDDVSKGWPRVSREAAEEAVKLAALALVDMTEARSWDREHDLPRPWEKPLSRRRNGKVRTK